MTVAALIAILEALTPSEKLFPIIMDQVPHGSPLTTVLVKVVSAIEKSVMLSFEAPPAKPAGPTH